MDHFPDPSAFNVRSFTAADYPALTELWESLGLGGKHRGDTLEVIQNTLEKGGSLLLLEVAATGKIIGSAWMTEDGRRTYLHHFGIAGEWQGKKLSRILMDRCMQVAREKGYQVKLEVYRENGRAAGLYKKYGFRYLGDYDVYIIRNLEE